MFTATAILSVALAVGLAGSVLAVVVATFFTPLPYTDPSRLVELWQTPVPGSDQVQDYLQPQRMEEWSEKENARSLSAIAGSGLGGRLILARRDGPVGVSTKPIIGDWFDVLGVEASQGRTLGRADLTPDAPPAAVISESFRERWLPEGVGSVVELSGVSFTVVGVMPTSFDPEETIWMPAGHLPDELRPLAYAGVGRIRSESSVAEATLEIKQMAAAQIAADSALYGGFGATARPIGAQARGPDKPMLWLLTGVIGAVLLMGLSNLTQIFLVHAHGRSTALAVRIALGGSPWQVGRVLLLEALIIGFAGAGLGLCLTVWGKSLARALLSGSYVFQGDPAIGAPVFAMAVAMAFLVSGLIGLEPLRRLPAMNLQSRLQGRSGGSESTAGERRTRDLMVAIQVALCLVLAAGARVVHQTYQIISGLDMGYDSDRIVQVVPDYGLLEMEPEAQLALVERLMPRLAARPEIEQVVTWHFVGQDYPPRPDTRAVTDGPDVELGLFDSLYSFYRVSPDFFAALGIPLVRGRAFEEADRAGTAPVAIVTRRGAESWWPGMDAIGRQIRLGAQGTWLTIVGVAEDMQPLDAMGRFTGTRDRSRMMPLLFVPIEQMTELPSGWRVYPGRGEVALAGRASRHTDEAIHAIEEEVGALMPELPITQAGNLHDLQMDGYLGRSIAVTGGLVGAGVVTALLLATLGIVGLVVEGLTRRTKEIGVRLALGARSHHVVALVASDGARTTLVGLLLGLVFLFMVERWAFRAVFGFYVERLSAGLLDPLVLLTAALVVVCVSVGASTVTARRAASVDPNTALRAE